MPGSPDPVLGSIELTVAVSVVAAALVASLPVVFRDELPPPRRLALGGGLGYALFALAAWTGARAATDAFVVSPVERPGAFVVLLAVGAVVLAVQAAVPLYLYARWRLVTPLVGLFGATTLVLTVFLQVRGESDPLALYALFFGPLVVGILVLVALTEAGVGRAIAAVR